MTRTPEEQQRHEQDTALAIQKLQEIGRTYGRLIFQKTVMFDLSMPELEAGVDSAVADTRGYLMAGGICEQDLEVAIYHLRLSIIEEGRRLVAMLPMHESETIQ